MLSFLPHLENINVNGYLISVSDLSLLAGAVFGTAVIFIETIKSKLELSVTTMIYLIYFILGNVFSRLFFILSRIYLHHDFESQTRIFYFYTEQRVSFGVFLGLVLAVPLGSFLLAETKGLLKYYDIFFIGYVVAFLFIRVGNALTYYQPGKITTAFWGSYYLGHYRHEPSFYEAVSLAALLITIFLIRKKIKKPGLLALIILAWTSLSRFITDFFRNDDLPLANFKYANAFISSNYHLASWLTLNQLAYFLVFLVAFSWIIYTFTVDGYCEPEEGFAGKRSPEKER